MSFELTRFQVVGQKNGDITLNSVTLEGRECRVRAEDGGVFGRSLLYAG